MLRSFILSHALIGFPASPDECDEKTLLDQEITTIFSVFHKNFEKLFHESNRPHFLWVSWRNKPTWDVGRTLEKLVNHLPASRDLQAYSTSNALPWACHLAVVVELE